MVETGKKRRNNTMNLRFLKTLPVIAAMIIAASCGKDDDNNAPEKKQNASPQEKTIIYNPDGTITVPFTVKVNTGKSLTKKMEYSEGEDGKINIKFVVGTNDDAKLRVSGTGVSGELGLILSEGAGGVQTYVFSGDLTLSDDVTAADLEKGIELNYEYGTALTKPASSSESLLALVTNCNHLYKGAANSNVETITLTDQNAYLAISMSPCCEHILQFNGDEQQTFTVQDGQIWIAIPSDQDVTIEDITIKKLNDNSSTGNSGDDNSTGNSGETNETTFTGFKITKSEDQIDASTIYSIKRQYFTVSSNGKRVHFSKGNLQYNPTETNHWRFAKHQYDCCGAGNDITAWYNTGYNGWIDLFGWGMWLEGNDPNYPNDPLRIGTENDAKYYSGIKTKDFKYQSLPDNPVIGSEWTTLTAGQATSNQEWAYLLKHLKGFGGGQITIEGGVIVNGIILLPDDFPEDITFKSCAQDAVHFTDNQYADVDAWKIMEANGAVFMPAAGRAVRSGDVVSLKGFNTECRYWTSTAANNDDDNAYIIYAYDPKFYQGNLSRCDGMPVRLVRPL